MLRTKSRRRRPAVESLEPRVVLNAPAPFPGSPLELPQGAWRSTPFIGSPVLADLTGDGRDEILTAAAGGRLVAYSAGPDGQLRELRRFETGIDAEFRATPVVVPRPDGSTMIVAGLGRDEFIAPGQVDVARVFAWDAATGRLLPGWPQLAGIGSVVGPLASGDLTGDGVAEIVVASFYGQVSAFRQDGSLLWQFRNDDTILSGAVIGDVDRDGRPEVVIGADSSDSPFFRAGGLINVLNADGSAKFRIPTGEVIWSSPVLADLNGDGFLEIVVGTGLNFSMFENGLSPARRAEARQFANQILAYDHRGQVVPGWPYRTTLDPSENRQVYASPAVADLTGDGLLEVVATDFAGFVHAVRADGRPLPGFEGGRRLLPPLPGNGDTYSSPIIADVDGDGLPDVVAPTRQHLVALDRLGNEIWTITAPQPPGGLPDGFANAAAIGQLDGLGGLELVTATNLFAAANPPRAVSVFRLPESPLTPPWPMLRKSPDGKAVAHSPSFLERHIRGTFLAILGREASASDLRFFSDLIRANVWTPKILADTVALTPEARSVVLRQLYQSYLRRPPSAEELAAGQDELASGTAEELARRLLLSPESLARTDGTTPGILARFYETILRRPITPPEVAILQPVVEQGFVPLPEIARLLLRSEEFALLELAAPTVIAYRSEFPDAPFDEAGVAAVLMDVRGGRREEEIRAGIVASGGRYERTSLPAALVRSAIADLTLREATPAEVAAWLRGFTTGEVSPPQFLSAIVDGPEARALFVREQFRELLGREPDAGAVASLANFASREELKIALTASDEYFARAGGTNAGFVRAIFRDVYGVDPLPQAVLNQQVDVLNRGRQTRAGLARALAFDPIAFERVVVTQLFRFLPDERKGVLRIPIETPGAPANNPDPGLVRGLVAARQGGLSEADTLVALLGSPAYFGKISYVRGLYRGTGLRS